METNDELGDIVLLSSKTIALVSKQSKMEAKQRYDIYPSFAHVATNTMMTQAQTTPPQVKLGNLALCPAVILAPMAGVTTPSFRRLCRQYGASLTISEMLHAQLFMAEQSKVKPSFDHDEIRSVQLYGTDPTILVAAAQRLISEYNVSHIDLNFGCPAPKILRRGGGAAIPTDLRLLTNIARAVVGVGNKAGVPVTAKMRLGCFGKLTYLDAALVLEQEGIAGITLHSRLAEDRYTLGTARAGWHHIARLCECVSIPVFGNGDVFTAGDATALIQKTGVQGIVIGRGALGRPWLFADIKEAVFNGHHNVITIPSFEEVRDTMLMHTTDEVETRTRQGITERDALRSMRKWFGWYWQGYTGLPSDWLPSLRAVDDVIAFKRIALSFHGEGINFEHEKVIAERGKVD